MVMLLALAWAEMLSAGQAAPASLFVQVRQKTLSIAQGSLRRQVDLSQLFQGYVLNESKLLHASADGKALYLVVFISGPSRSPIAAQSFCGAGTEGYLLWLMFDQAWREQKRQSALIESCFESADGSYEIKAGRLTAEWDNYRLEKHFRLEYDANAAARGFAVAESKIEAAK